MSIRVKICGLREQSHVEAAVRAKAGYVGFVFFPKSPRAVSVQEAQALAIEVPPGIAKVALTVNADDAALEAILESVPLDMLQLHGSESAERIAQVRQKFGLPVMKAIGIGSEEDLPKLQEAMQVADQVLVDARAPKGAVLPGGNGVAFDWRLIANRRWSVPWVLAGGLTPANVAEAIRLTGAEQVDVSSGVESAPGVKDAALIEAFIRAAR